MRQLCIVQLCGTVEGKGRNLLERRGEVHAHQSPGKGVEDALAREERNTLGNCNLVGRTQVGVQIYFAVIGIDNRALLDGNDTLTVIGRIDVEDGVCAIIFPIRIGREDEGGQVVNLNHARVVESGRSHFLKVGTEEQRTDLSALKRTVSNGTYSAGFAQNKLGQIGAGIESLFANARYAIGDLYPANLG